MSLNTKITKVLKDTLQNKGRWSMKRMTAFVTMVFILLLGTFIVISDKVLSTVINPYGIRVFDSLVLFEVALLGLAEAGKKFKNEVGQTKEEEEEEQ